MRNWTLTALAAVAALLPAGCRDDSNPGGRAAEDGRVVVAVSIPPQAWLVGRVGGEHVRVITLLGPGDDPHTYQPSDAQVSEVMRSRVYFRIGVPFETGKWSRAIASAGGPRLVDTQQGIELREMEGPDRGERHGSGHEGKDPHVWLSPRLLKLQARTVADTLAQVDPAHEQDYRANLADVQAELDRLDRDLHRVLDPIRGGAFIVFHPAWGYFADEYGLRQVAIEIEGKEPSDRELTDLTRQAERIGAKVVFVQPQIAGRSAQAVARAIGGRTERLDPLAEDVPGNLRSAAQAIAAAVGRGNGK